MDATFEEKVCILWPALLLMQGGRDSPPASRPIGEIRGLLRATRHLSDEDLDVEALSSPVPATEVVVWLQALWHRLAAADAAEIARRRRSILQSILDSSLSDEDKSRLVTALDYLSRLSNATRVARAAQGLPAPAIPATQSRSMQRAYQRIAAFAATDLPVWLAGEPGTELLWAARLIHRLRGGTEAGIHVWEPSQHGVAPVLDRFLDERPANRTGSLTIVARNVDQGPALLQRYLYDRLKRNLSIPSEYAIIVTTAPYDLDQEPPASMCVELFTFLRPTRVEIPPIRRRIEDLLALMGFTATSLGQPNLVERCTAHVKEVLAAYHWPGNTDELESVVAFLAKRRPSGPIRLEDLPDTLVPQSPEEKAIVERLERLHRSDGFRTVETDSGRRSMARFLGGSKGRRFDAVEFQATFHLGRETARRLLRSLMDCGLIEGIKGPQGKRVTGYRLCSNANTVVDD